MSIKIRLAVTNNRLVRESLRVAVAALLCGNIVGNVQPVYAQPNAILTPHESVTKDAQEFVKQLFRGNNAHYAPWMALSESVENPRRGYFGVSEWYAWWVKYGAENYRFEESVVEKVEGTVAVVTLKCGSSIPQSTEKFSETLNLKWGTPKSARNEPHWQFVPQKPEKFSLYSQPIHWAVYMLGQPPGSLQDFRAEVSAFKQKRLALGLMQFTQDWSQRFAFDADLVEEATLPYLKDENLWVIPGTKDHYTFNRRLAGKRLNDVQVFADTVMLYEGTDEQPVFRYRDKAVICFADGHVELVDRERMKTVRWEP